MHTPWIGNRRILVIPTRVLHPSYELPPSNWAELVGRRIYYDPDPETGIDRSLRAYISTISYGQARLEADISEPVVVDAAPDGSCRTVAAIQAHPSSHLYEYACIVFMDGSHFCSGMAAWHTAPIKFTPARLPNLVRNRCRVRMDESLGVWAMEVLHMTTAFGDLYKTDPHPGRFDEMACSCGTHPSVFTKLSLGWVQPGHVPTVITGDPATFTLHAIGLLQPPPPGRVTGVRIPSTSPRQYFVEARLAVDPYERQTTGISDGIPSEGVVVYEASPEWPLKLRTPTALAPGQSFTSTAEQLEIAVTGAVPGGFTVSITSIEHSDCPGIREDIERNEGLIGALQEQLATASPAQKPGIVDRIRTAQAKLKAAYDRGTDLGCRLPQDI
jgi:hypothetical protein